MSGSLDMKRDSLLKLASCSVREGRSCCEWEPGYEARLTLEVCFM